MNTREVTSYPPGFRPVVPTSFRSCGAWAGVRVSSAVPFRGVGALQAGRRLLPPEGVRLRPSGGRPLALSATARAPAVVDLGARVPPSVRPRHASQRPTISVTYTIQKVPEVRAVSISSRPIGVTSSPDVRPPIRPSPSPVNHLASAAASIAKAAREVAAARPVLNSAALSAATAAGVVTPLSAMAGRELVFQLSRLVAILPVAAIAFACACTVADVVKLSADRLAQHFVSRGRQSVWTAGTVRDVHNVWARFMAFCERREIVHDGKTFNAVDLGEFLTSVDVEARAKGAANQARAAAKDAAAAASAQLRGIPPPPRTRWQDGTHALVGVTAKLQMLVTHFGMVLPLAQACPRRAPGRKVRDPTPAYTIGMVFRMYDFVSRVAEAASPSHSEMAHAAVAAAILFACFSCNRCEQANGCFFDGERDGFLHGVIVLDKHPNPLKRKARPFYMRLAGPDGKTTWFEFLKRVLTGVEGGCFVFRDYEGSDNGDPGLSTGFRNNPLSGHRLVHAIQCVLVRVCGLSPADAKLYAKHSSRHFLMEVSGARKEPAVRAVEIGRWSGSTAQDPDLAPAARQVMSHQLRAGVMPEAYAPLAKVTRVCSILGDQMNALANLWTRCVSSGAGIASIPISGDFSPLEEWTADPLGA